MIGGLSSSVGIKPPKRRSRPKGEKALNFDGTDDYVEISDFTYATTGDFTISFWVNRNTSWDENNTGLFAQSANKSNTFYIGTLLTGVNSGRLALFAAVGGSNTIDLRTTDHDMSTNTWYHVAAVVDRSSASNSKFYIDGEPVSMNTQTIADTTTSIDQSANMRIGNNSASASYFRAAFKDFMIHSAALSQKHIKKIFQHKGRKRLLSTPQIKNNLELYLPLGDGTEAGSGSTVYDMSGNGRNGTITGAQFLNWVY
tara:strand:- start:1255 stop:2022 length:768 start_codon:yes stop_codon:yes gene_type:complete